MYEHRSQALIPRGDFMRRLFLHVIVALLVVGGSVALGMIGYMGLASMSPIEAFLSSVLILTTMGPAHQLPNDAAKIFEALFALYSSLVFLIVGAIIFAPLLHRLLHVLHVERDEARPALPHERDDD